MHLVKTTESDVPRQSALRWDLRSRIILGSIGRTPRERHKARFEGDTSPRIANEKNLRNARLLTAPYKSIFFYSEPEPSPKFREAGRTSGGKVWVRSDLRASHYVYHTASIARDHEEEDEGSVLLPRDGLLTNVDMCVNLPFLSLSLLLSLSPILSLSFSLLGLCLVR